MVIRNAVKLDKSGNVLPIVVNGYNLYMYTLFELNLQNDDDWLLVEIDNDTLGTIVIPINRKIYHILQSIPNNVRFQFEDYTQNPGPKKYLENEYLGVLDEIGYYDSKIADKYNHCGGYEAFTYALGICIDYCIYRMLEELLNHDTDCDEPMKLPKLVQVLVNDKPSEIFDEISLIIQHEFNSDFLGIIPTVGDSIIRIVNSDGKLKWVVDSGNEVRRVKLKGTKRVYLSAAHPSGQCPLYFTFRKTHYKLFRKMHSVDVSVALVPRSDKIEDAFKVPCIEDFVFANESLGMIAMLLANVPFIFASFKAAHKEPVIDWKEVEFAYQIKGYIKNSEVEALPILYQSPSAVKYQWTVLYTYINSVLFPHKKGEIL